jgi:tetratricopeptide (TPR) repeat protein
MPVRLILAICLLVLVGCRSGQRQYIEKANHFVLSGDDASAAVEFEKALQAGTADWKLEKVTGDCYLRLKDYENALRHYDAAVTIMKNDFKWCDRKRVEEDDPDQERLHRETIETRIFPCLAEVYVAEARIYCVLGRDEAASFASELALIYDQKNLVARRLFAQLLEKSGNHEKALKQWTAFLAQARNATPSEREANGITEKELTDTAERISKLLSRQREK